MLGVGCIGLAVYTALDPLSRGRSFVSGAEWEQDPKQAQRKDRAYTYVWAGVMILIGLASFLVGLTT
ncbi:hypothetical protein GCM10008995_01760 [Halobellus salinus]|uniref:Uncharacterized protein n=1 Tax=Halobellus salinus TaxID=931585 RepID=A0A830E6V4_9EURY|nr:hypothetical protein GCM10008995_01760 [Halobellus salinus]